MKYAAFLAVTLFLFGTLACQQARSQTAKAELLNSQGQEVASATLTDGPEGVKIALEASNLPPGLHGFHIHTVGKCDPPDFKSAGGHFNPHSKKHGLQNPEGPHAGDLPNLTVEPEGTANVEVVAAQVTLGDGEHSLFDHDGSALVIHAGPDDEKSDPAGNAGPRVACGVIVK